MTLPGCRQAKEMLGNFNHRRSENLIRFNKNNLRILTGFLTGHCRLKGHLKKMGITEENGCRFCQEQKETRGTYWLNVMQLVKNRPGV